MKKILILIIVFIILGFLISFFLSKSRVSCTEMACPCMGITGERPCNTCFRTEQIFITGILDVNKRCRTQEIIVCESGRPIDTKIAWEDKNCNLQIEIFGLNLNNLIVKPNRTVSN